MSKSKPRLHRCSMCNRPAVWMYLPSHKGRTMFCDEHVPRGCGCNNYDIEFDGEPIPNKEVVWFPRDHQDFSNLCSERKPDSYHYQYLDNNGKIEPCCEYDYNPEGIEFIEKITVSPIVEVEKAITKALERVGYRLSDEQKKKYKEICFQILEETECRGEYINHNSFMCSITDFSSKPRPIKYRLVAYRILDILSNHRTTITKEEWNNLQN